RRALAARAGDLVIIRRGDAALRRAARPLPSDSFVWECSRSVPPPLDSVRWPDRNLPTSGQTSRRNAGRPNSVHIPSDEWRPRVTSDTPTDTESLSEHLPARFHRRRGSSGRDAAVDDEVVAIDEAGFVRR